MNPALGSHVTVVLNP